MLISQAYDPHYDAIGMLPSQQSRMAFGVSSHKQIRTANNLSDHSTDWAKKDASCDVASAGRMDPPELPLKQGKLGVPSCSA